MCKPDEFDKLFVDKIRTFSYLCAFIHRYKVSFFLCRVTENVFFLVVTALRNDMKCPKQNKFHEFLISIN